MNNKNQTASRFIALLYRLAAAWLLALACSASALALTPAFYYGPLPFPHTLRNFDTWIVEPSRLESSPDIIRQHQDTLFAYVSLGEVDSQRTYAGRMPATWLKGKNTTWNSRVIDQSAAGWPEFFVNDIIAPLRARGFRHFFLDTLDSYHLIAKTPEARQAQEQGMVQAIHLLKARFPDSRLILNRGFEILPDVRQWVTAVAAESLFQSWDNASRQYRPVSETDRAWLKSQLARVRDEYGLPVIVIDYAPPAQRKQARDLATSIRASGFIPWIGNGDLTNVGTGVVQPLPRKILMLYDDPHPGDALRNSDIHRFAAMPINYLGLVPEYRHVIREGLPDADLAGQYAGIVTWFHDSEPGEKTRLGSWLLRQIDDGIPVAVLGHFGFDLSGAAASRLGLAFTPGTGKGRITVRASTPGAAFEAPPRPIQEEFFPLAAGSKADVWLKTTDGSQEQDAVAITPWGGYALSPFVIRSLDLGSRMNTRWTIDPFLFFRQALKLGDRPVPDVTTENGYRLLMVHIDGDGFASKAELPGTPWAAEVMYRDILKRYPLPTTVSVIEGEISKNGKYPQFSSQLEPIARRIFALPHVEAASHSFSHPFKWQAFPLETDGEDYNLDIAGYQFDLSREIEGSVKYVESLLPAGKRCRTFLWTGDCNPDEATIARTYQAGLLNMNGGETTLSATNPTLTAVAPLGIPRGKVFQVFAPNQNENLYTNLWSGPFYGYERVIETFELTDKPRRLKPVDIYYHTYSASKLAALKALQKVYDWALGQPLAPVHASTYIRKVLDFNQMTLALEGDGWRIGGGSDVRTLRIPKQLGYPDLARSQNILGWWDEGDTRYIHLGEAETGYLVLSDQPAARPWVARANGRIHGAGKGWTIQAHRPVDIEIGGAGACDILVDGKRARPQRLANGLVSVKSSRHHAHVEVRCVQ